MAEATFKHGDPTFESYTPSTGNVSSGQVILAGNTSGLTTVIAHQDITNATLGAVAIGGGVYEVVMLSNIAQWGLAYWDDTNNKLTSTSTNNATFGFVVKNGAAGANATVFALHAPWAPRV